MRWSASAKRMATNLRGKMAEWLEETINTITYINEIFRAYPILETTEDVVRRVKMRLRTVNGNGETRTQNVIIWYNESTWFWHPE
jgi:hypothetical protein